MSLTVEQSKHLTPEGLREVAAWLDEHGAELPDTVRVFMEMHQAYLVGTSGAAKALATVFRELRRALGITPSSEKRPSGRPLDGLPKPEGSHDEGAVQGKRAALEAKRDESLRLGGWHDGLHQRHDGRVKSIEEQLARLPPDETSAEALAERITLESIQLSPEQKAESAARGKRYAENLVAGGGKVEPELAATDERLMPEGAVLTLDDTVPLEAQVPEGLAAAEVVRTLHEPRARYDFGVVVTRVELDVEKKILVDEHGERHVVSASTSEYGPPRFQVTWNALATLTALTAQFAMPLNRLATLVSTEGKRFTAGALSRMLHYVAERFLPVYLELAHQLADADILAGDDTPSRVLQVNEYFARTKDKPPGSPETKPPWASYRNPGAASYSQRECEKARKARLKRREDGDRSAMRGAGETPSLGVLIGAQLPFESQRRNGDGAKQSLNTTVVSGRSVDAEPSSVIVFYRSHLGSCGNLFEALLRRRDSTRKSVYLQGDLSSSNAITDKELLQRVRPTYVGCAAHARRPFANYEHEDTLHCPHMLHLFLGLAMHEEHLTRAGRNRDNVLAVRGEDSRRVWERILELAKKMATKWSPATKLGAGANYIIKHFEKLTAYLSEPRLEASNNHRERMLRTEKLIEGSSMFRRSLEGRFVLDVLRTVLQTAVAARVPIQEYLVYVLRTPPEDVAENPARYSPFAYGKYRAAALEATREVATGATAARTTADSVPQGPPQVTSETAAAATSASAAETSTAAAANAAKR